MSKPVENNEYYGTGIVVIFRNSWINTHENLINFDIREAMVAWKGNKKIMYTELEPVHMNLFSSKLKSISNDSRRSRNLVNNVAHLLLLPMMMIAEYFNDRVLFMINNTKDRLRRIIELYLKVFFTDK